MEHISIGVYDYERNKLCDLYDSFIQAEGQAYNIVYKQELNGWQELTFNLPFVIDSERNFRWDYIKSEYLVRLELGEAGEQIEWFVLQKPKASKNSKSISNAVTCPHLSTLLKTKNIYLVFDDETGIGTIDDLLTRALTNTGWTLGECDTILERDGVTEKIRSLKSDGKKGAYQLVIDICNLFKAYPIYHGDTKTIDIHALTNKGPMAEMYIGKNLNAISIEQATDNIITRLYVEGEYGDFGYVGIDDVNPTGLSYLMNFDYYKSIGLFTDTHQAAYDAYISDMLAAITGIKNKQRSILTTEDRLNTLWGQIDYVIYELSGGDIVKIITGGTVTDEQKQIAEGDELYVLKAIGNYRVITAGSGGSVTFANNDVLAAKFVTLPNGLIGAKQVSIESKEKVVTTLTRDKNNQVDPLKQASIQEQIDANNASIQELYTGYSSYTLATGGYFTTSGATVDMTNMTADLSWKNCIVECQPGDVFYITGHGGIDQRLWCFVNATYSDIAANALSTSAASAVGSNTEITAPANTTHLVCNFNASYVSTLKKHILSGDGLYDEMREAIEQAVTLDNLMAELVELQADQLEIEATFAAAMGDMLRDGYWSDTNYAPGQEESLYLDALDVIEQMSKPTVTYTFSQVALSEAMGYTESLPEINDKVTIWDEELKLYDVVYVSKRTQYLDDMQKDTVEVTNDDPSLSGQSFESVLSRMSQLADMLQQKNTMYERAGAINANGSIYIDRLNGTLNVMKNKITSSIGSWYTDDRGGIVFESAAGDSAMMLNGAGLLIADGKTPDGDWNWRTALDGLGICADRIITGYLSADRIEAGSITTNKLSSEVGQSLDLSSNTSINLIVEDLEDEISRVAEDNFGQQLKLVFSNGMSLESDITYLPVAVKVFKDGVDYTNDVPASYFNWERFSNNSAADTAWKNASSHIGKKNIVLQKTDIGESCTIRCTISAYQSTDLNLVSMYVDAMVFDHAMVKSTHITLEQDKLEIASQGNLDILANANINVKNGGNINIQSGGHLNVAAGSINLSSSTTLDDELSGLNTAITTTAENAFGQQMKVTFPYGTSYESETTLLGASVTVFKNGVDVTNQVASSYFSWERISTNSTADATWNSNHTAMKSITLQKSDIGKSCTIRCSMQAVNITGLKLAAMSVDTLVFDHSLVKTSHITIEDQKVEIASAGHLDVLANANINVANNGNINISSGGKLHVAASDIQLTSSSTLDSELSKVTTMVDQKADGVTVQVLETRVNNISVGGTNLLPNSEEDRTANRLITIPVHDILENYVGEQICVSFEIKGTIARDFQVFAYQSSGISIEGTHLFTMPTTDFQRFSFVTKVKNYGQQSGMSTGEIAWYDQVGANPFTLRRIKIELGNMPTDWTPAPEDPVETLANTVVTIDTAGVAMTGGVLDFDARSQINFHSDGKFNVFATDDDSAIKFGGTEENPNFSLGSGGTVKAKTIYADALEVNNLQVTGGSSVLASVAGSMADRIKVSTTEPSGHGIIWVQPTGGGGTATNVDFVLAQSSGEGVYGATPDPVTLQGDFVRQGNAVGGSTCTYGVKFRIYNYQNSCRWNSVTVSIQRTDGTGNPVIVYSASPNKFVDVGGYFSVDTLNNPASGNCENITDASSLKMTVTIVKSASTYARFEVYEPFTIRCYGSSSGGTSTAQPCNVFYIP